MANNRFQFKRTSTSGLLPNTTNSANNSYIAAGEFAVNLTDKKVVSSNGTAIFEIGANVSNIYITGSLTANGSTGSNNQVLTSNGSGIYWSEKSASGATFNYTLSNTAPSTPGEGDVWIDNTDGTRYEWLIDADGGQWVNFTSESAGTPVFIQNSAPTLSGTPYLWIQTGLAGNNITFWVEDGQ